MTFYKLKRKRNSIALRLLGENTDVAPENEVSVSKDQKVAMRLNSKPNSIPIGCTENIEHKRKHFSRRNVGNSLFLPIMMMDDSATFQEGWFQEGFWKD